MRILITGANGFTGKHLKNHLLDRAELFCIDVEDCNLTQPIQVEKLLKNIKPDQIYHLAGSFTNDYSVDYANNVLATKNLLDTVHQLKFCCRILLIGSAAEYGIPKKNPIHEESDLNPVSIYGMTKVFQTHLMKFYVAAFDLDIVMARTFNLFGKGISNRLFAGRVYEQIEQLKKGLIEKIQLGDLSSERDYIEGEKAVSHYETIMNRGQKGGIYNVGSGKPIKIKDLLTRILKEHDLDLNCVIENRTAKSTVSEIYSDIGKLIAL